jgi:hypothetical protein
MCSLRQEHSSSSVLGQRINPQADLQVEQASVCLHTMANNVTCKKVMPALMPIVWSLEAFSEPEGEFNTAHIREEEPIR